MRLKSNLQVFVVNLDRDKQRLKEFTAHMDKLGVPFARWAATEGDSLDASNFGVAPILPGVWIEEFEEWSRNEAACGVSHILLLQHIVEKAFPWTLVLEDDGFLNRTIPLEICEWEFPHNAEIILVNNRSRYLEIRVKGNNFSYGELSGGAGTDGYLISLQGASKLLDALYPLRAPLDFQMFAHCSSIHHLDHPPYHWRLPQNPSKRDVLLNSYRLVDPLVQHADDGSSIGNQRHPLAHYYCNVLLGLFFDEEKTYTCSDIILKNHLVRIDSQPSNEVIEWKGVDISLLDENLKYWHPQLRTSQPPMRILSKCGVNLVRISVWVDNSSVMNLDRALRLARRAREEGLQICLVLHYSDTWTDPAKQTKPETWRPLSFDELCAQVYTYTYEVVEAMRRIGCQPVIVQIGNEITNGVLWEELGEKSDSQRLLYDRDWSRFAAMIHHATRGVRDVAKNSGSQIKTMLHFDNGTKLEQAIWWFTRAEAYKIDFDMIGLSFYPLAHDGASPRSIDKLSILNVHFPSKEIMLVETAFPYRRVYDLKVEVSSENPPFSTEGQHSYLQMIVNQMQRIPNNAGVCWWGAFFINDSIEPCPYLFSSQALFDRNGVALPALSAFMDGEHDNHTRTEWHSL